MSHERRIPPGVRVTASLQRALEEWQASVVLLDQMDPVTTELVRLRAAAYHDCRACKSLRTTTGRDAGVDETMTAKVDRYETSDLPERHKVALRFADAMMTQPGQLSSELKQQLHQHFTDAFGRSHHVHGVDGLVGRHVNHVADAVIHARAQHVERAPHVVVDGVHGVVLHEGHVLVGRGVEDRVGLDLAHQHVHAKGVRDVRDA